MKKLLMKIGEWINNLLSKTTSFVDSKAESAIKVVNIIKEAVNSNALDLYVKLTPSQKDDEILAKAKKTVIWASSLVLEGIDLFDSGLSNEEVLKGLTKYLSGLSQSERVQFYINLAGKILLMLEDGKITLAEAIDITQELYHKFK